MPTTGYGGVHSLLICSISPLGFPTCHQASQQENTYCTKYQKADRASTLVTLWLCLLPQYLHSEWKNITYDKICAGFKHSISMYQMYQNHVPTTNDHQIITQHGTKKQTADWTLFDNCKDSLTVFFTSTPARCRLLCTFVQSDVLPAGRWVHVS
jgi:hypothetical protein